MDIRNVNFSKCKLSGHTPDLVDYYINANGSASNLWAGSLDDSDVHSSLRIISIGSFMKFSENFETNIQGQVPLIAHCKSQNIRSVQIY